MTSITLILKNIAETLEMFYWFTILLCFYYTNLLSYLLLLSKKETSLFTRMIAVSTLNSLKLWTPESNLPIMASIWVGLTFYCDGHSSDSSTYDFNDKI